VVQNAMPSYQHISSPCCSSGVTSTLCNAAAYVRFPMSKSTLCVAGSRPMAAANAGHRLGLSAAITPAVPEGSLPGKRETS